MLRAMEVSGFRLDEATASERIARDRLTWEAWGDRLSRAQYLERERVLRQTDHGRLAHHTWALRVLSGVVVGSCETYRLPLLRGGAVEVIASVYVERALRGVKMASRMLHALVAQRREAGIDALILFSEVGTDLYERLRFKKLPAPTRTWAAQESSIDPEPFVVRRPEELGLLLAHRNRLRSDDVDVRATIDLVDWHVARSRFYARTLERPEAASLGARDGDVVALWCPDHKNGVLRILDASGPAGAGLERLAAIAQHEAARLGLSRVELWDDAHSARLTGGTSHERDDDLPMGQPFTPRGELFLGPLARLCWA